MKKFLLIAGLLVLAFFRLAAQEGEENEKIREKMGEFIQKRMSLSKDEAAKFNPVFIRYFKEWRNTLKDNRGDKLILQQRIVELRLRYRNEFREIIGEKRGNEVFQHQDVFIKELRGLKEQRIQNRNMRPGKNLRSVIE